MQAAGQNAVLQSGKIADPGNDGVDVRTQGPATENYVTDNLGLMGGVFVAEIP